MDPLPYQINGTKLRNGTCELNQGVSPSLRTPGSGHKPGTDNRRGQNAHRWLRAGPGLGDCTIGWP